ncbi:MAG: GNAT family N-acetyltransferase, partial [Chloroflexi bacterium]
HDEIERMTDEAHSSETLLLLAEGTEVVGYVFLEVRRRAQVAFFWYLAIDEAKRRHGLGASMVRHALDVVRERWPACRAVFLETAHPTDRDDSASDAGWRLAFYQKLGFWRVRGLTYEVPVAKAAGEHSTSLRYDPLFFPLRGDGEDLSDAFVKRGVLEMARVYFDEFPNDPRWAALVASETQPSEPPTARGGTT